MLWCLNFNDISPAGDHCHDCLLEAGKGQLLFSQSSDNMTFPSFSFFFSFPHPLFGNILRAWI